MNDSFSPLPLPSGITEKYVDCSFNGLNFHILEAGDTPSHNPPLLLLLHGYPELAFSWRKVMPTLANAGYYVVAPDQRGYGRTTGWDNSPWSNTELSQFTMTNLVRDLVVLVYALGYTRVHAVIGHDFGAVASSMCALMRPDMFQSCIMMSHPFDGTPGVPFNYAHTRTLSTSDRKPSPDIYEQLAKLDPPRKHYKHYNSAEHAASEWDEPPQGLSAFLRGYIHLKSADWTNNNPRPLSSWSATELAKLPEYYVMPLSLSMPETVSKNMSGEDEGKTKSWLPDSELDVYVSEWTRTGFQGGLNWYRAQLSPKHGQDMALFAGKKIEVPAAFISGQEDWGNYQKPGALERLGERCSAFKGVRMIEGAGHWPQQEQPESVTREILGFLDGLR